MQENENYKILLVDDEPDILEFLAYNLKKEGFQVQTAQNGREALKVAQEQLPHLIVLDVMMPGMDGIETCEEIKKQPQLQDSLVAFLTARGEDYSQIAGFEAGADDYIAKPIKPRVLISRIQALLRRKGVMGDESVTEIDGLILDKDRYIVTVDGEDLTLPKKEFELLALLISKPGRVFTREGIYDAVWGDDVVGDRTIDVHIRKLREKLGNERIITIKGVGYKLAHD